MVDASIFWAEGDDDAGAISGIAHLSRLSYAAYLLMGKQVVIHPAYIWQDDDTHQLVFPNGTEVARPKNTSLVLGGSADASDYIQERVDKLSRQERSGERVVELEQYRKYEGVLLSEANALDDHFVAQDKVHQLSWSRDGKFRELVRHDLEDERPFGPHLHSRIVAATSIAHRDMCVKRLIGLTRDTRRLVSVDSVVRVAIKNGFHRRLRNHLETRLHVLHWMAHQGPNLRVPLLASLESRIDCDDPSVFWAVMDKLFGADLRNAVVSEQWSQVLVVTERIRGDILWQEFMATYRDIVEIIKTDQGEICDRELLKGLRTKYPQLVNAALPKLSRFGWLSLVCTLLTLQMGMPLLSMGGAIGTIGDAIQNSVRAYHGELCVGRTALKVRIGLLLKAELGRTLSNGS